MRCAPPDGPQPLVTHKPPAAAARLGTLALLLATLLTPGCAYFRNLGKDAAETLHLGVGASLTPNLLVYVQAPIFAVSVGYLGGSTYVGSDHGYCTIWHQAGVGVLAGGQLVRTRTGVPIERFWSGRLDEAYLDQSHYLALNIVATDRRTASSTGQIGLTKFSVGAHVLFIGISVGFDFLEILDFATGIVGYDMLGDDDYGRSDPPPEAPTEPAEPAEDAAPEADLET